MEKNDEQEEFYAKFFRQCFFEYHKPIILKKRLIIVLKKSYVENNQRKYIDRLREAVEIPSVSAVPENRKYIFEMSEWIADVIN